MKFESLILKKNLFDKNNWPLFILISIIIIAAFFRFYDLPLRYVFGDEELREAIIGIQGARDLQVPLTGGFSSAGRFTWGPWFFYQMIFASLILPHLYSPWLYLTLASFLSVIVLYKIGVELEGKYLGLILAALGAFSPALIYSAVHLTYPNLTNIFAMLSILISIIIIKRNVSYWWGFILGIVIGIAINIHYQMTGLLILILLLLIFRLKKYCYFITSLLGIFITFIPLLLFDLNNHWFNFKGVSYLLLYGKNAIYVPNSWTIYLKDFWPAVYSDVIGTPSIVSIFILILSIFNMAYLILRKISKPFLFILIAFIFNFIQLRYYWGERSFAYLMHLRPFIFIFTGFTIVTFYKLSLQSKWPKLRYFVVLASMLIFVMILPNSIDRLRPYPYTVDIYKTMDILEKEYPNKKFAIYICPKEYKGNDAALSKSLLFLIEHRKKIDFSGIKLGIRKEGNKISECEFSKNSFILNRPKYKSVVKNEIINISDENEQSLKNDGWEMLTFKSIYNSTVRWWFKEQP